MNYKALDRARQEVRLLMVLADTQRHTSSPVQCRLKTVSLNDDHDYIALSYVWGDPNITREIIVDEECAEVTESLEGALRRFRDGRHDICLWADALCINQHDLLEKGQQVQFMKRIYEQAKEVRVWLGVKSDDSDSAIDLLEALADVQSHCLIQAGGDFSRRGPRYDATLWGLPQSWNVSDELVALDRLFARSWWYRVWVIQEVAVSAEATLYCGSRSITWHRVVKAADFLMAHFNDVTALLLQRSSGVIHSIRGLYCVGGMDSVRVILRCGGRYPILVLLAHHCKAGATDERDKFIALAGLAQETGLLDNHQYYLQSVAEVYRTVPKLIATHQQDGSLDFLSYGGLPKKRTDLPSWTPDWSYRGSRTCALLQWQLQPPEISSYYGDLDRFNPAGDIEPANRFSFRFSDGLRCLTARGVKLDIVDELSPNLPRPQANAFISEQTDENIFKGFNPDVKQNNYTGIAELSEALWKTFVMDKSVMGEKAPCEWGRLFWALFPLPGAPAGPHSDYICAWYDTIRDFNICGYMVEQLLYYVKERHAPSFQAQSLGPDDLKILPSISAAIERATAFRRLITTCKGYVALAPADTRKGDVVCILFDCHVPLVLRPRDDHYEMIGESYVHGVMHGEAMKDMNGKMLQVQSFALH